ncbi:MAG: glycoside hydrolase family 9 protein [Bacteroidaceae bacterium]|nr:glycoside hydrolase family 9 protein [Bacteroidaceae bacterium]
MKKTIFSLAFAAAAISASAQETEIRLNQVGYYPHQEKVAIIECVKPLKRFSVTDENGKKVLKGFPSGSAYSSFSSEKSYRIDMSSITKPGTYTLEINKTKATFVVKKDALDDLCRAGIKAFYYQRSGMPIEAKYAGQWSRPAAHMDTEVLVHPSAATSIRPAGTKISSPKGWYDAGDYNKYIVNSAFAIGQMLNIYPLTEEYLRNLEVNIPESGNYVPDFLNELYYNLEWMLTMQDEDGGLYHKLTDPSFDPFVMPKDCHQTRYVVQKTTCASLDFAACMAMASRFYAPYERQFPGFSQKALDAAKKAYIWALKNPEVYYRQNELNKKYTPQIYTGTYDDENAKDELFWASVELYLATGNDVYMQEIEANKPKNIIVPVWGNVGALGLTSWLMNWNCSTKLRTPEVIPMEEFAKNKLVEWANNYIENSGKSMYLAPFGNKKSDFHWASMAEGAATEAILLLQAYKVTKDKRYLINARRNADYMLGRNPLGMCFVTGFGKKSPMNPHHRISSADGIKEPIPGLLVGGPNATANEGKYYESEQPDKRYADNQGSFTTNEIAINWNAALVALTAALQTLQDN